MKARLLLCATLTLVSLNLKLQAQSSLPLPQSSPTSPPLATLANNGSVLAENVVAGGRGPDFQDWLRVTVIEDGPGKARTETNLAYVELATGMHYREDGQWKKTREEIQPFAGGAIARHGQHKVIFAADLATRGAIDLESPAGGHLRSHVLGVGYVDSETGRTALIARVKSSTGKITGKNQVVYENAFADVRADVRYTYTQNGFEQDVVFRERPPVPEVYGFNPATTKLQILTEFLNPPQPKQRKGLVRSQNGTGRPDETLEFDGLRIGRGTAFLEGADGRVVMGANAADRPGIVVSKQWLAMSGRHVLVEEVPYDEIRRDLDALPAGGGRTTPIVSTSLQLPPAPAEGSGSARPMEIAGLATASPGFVMDYYTTLSGYAANYTFSGVNTYYISGALDLTGTTTFEGGAVIKYNHTNTASIALYGPVKCLTDMYRPVVFTSKSDGSVGQAVASGTPATYGGSALYVFSPSVGTNVELSNLRFNYANVGFDVGSDEGGTVTLRNVQFVKCVTAIKLGGYYDYPQINVYNGLIHNGTTAFHMWYGGTVAGQNLTIRAVTNLTTVESAEDAFLTLQNSLLVNIANSGDYTGSPNADLSGQAGTGVFVTAGAGYHYLATNTYRNQGTNVGINPQLLSDLKKMTTYPPLVLSNTISTATNLSIRAPRDFDVPDLGYHYAPLDYLLNQVSLWASLKFSNGVSLGMIGAYGLNLQNNADITSTGNPFDLNHVARFSAAQEQPTNLGAGVFLQSVNEGYPNLNFQFTDFMMGQGTIGYLVSYTGATPFASLTFRDCRLRATYLSILLTSIYWYAPVDVSFTNSIIEQSSFFLCQRYYYQDTFVMVNAYNNLFRGSALQLYYYYNDVDTEQNPSWYIRDNLFDGSPQSLSGESWEYYVTCSHNGFITNTSNDLGGSNNKQNLTADYQNGPLGPFYYPASGGSYSLANLINAGSRSAVTAGLSNYTTQVNGVPETNSTVDIGFHYISGQSSGGTNYWLAFYSLPEFAGPTPWRLMISGSVATSGTVSAPGIDPPFVSNFTIVPGVATNIELTNVAIFEYNTIGTNGVHITAGAPISVQALEYSVAASEAFLGFPTTLLGTNYCLMAYPSHWPTNLGTVLSQYLIVATETNTVITNYPSETANLHGHPGTNAFTITLHQGQTYQLRSSDEQDDVTGTFVTANKPIAVFAGARGAAVPEQAEAYNPLVEQQLPVNHWGVRALGVPFGSRTNGDIYRVLALSNTTIVTMNGVQVAELQRGGVFETNVTELVEFQGNKPIQVAQFAKSMAYGTSDPEHPVGDPCEILVPATSQYLDAYTLSIPDDSQYEKHYLNVVVEQSAISGTFLDGQSLSSLSGVTFTAIGSSGYSGAAIEVLPGSHVMTGSKPFGLLVYGFGLVEAYGHVGGIKPKF